MILSGKIRILKNLSLPLFLGGLMIILMVFGNSCANPGAGPGGGPSDSIPPVIIAMEPMNLQTNFDGSEINIVFDEYVVLDNLNNKLIVSPPLAEKPSIKTKGKGVNIKFNEDLVPDRTYSVDFKDGIKDYNEGNKIESLRLLFSTYDQLDTLRIEGFIVDAFTHEPIENTTVSLYSSQEDSVFTTLRPDFISKADDQGYFLFDNLPGGSYTLYALVDGNSDLIYNMASEQIAYIDTTITPTANYIARIDTLIQGNDTIVNNGYTEYFPKPVWTYLFTEKIYNQYLSDYKREIKDQMLFTFNEALIDSFEFNLIDSPNKFYIETGINIDSLTVWLTDTTTVHEDTLYAQLSYTVLDSLMQAVVQTDTLELIYLPEEKGKSKKKGEKEIDEENVFEFKTNLKTNNFDLNLPIVVVSPSPIKTMADTLFTLQKVVNDSTFEAVNFQIEQVSARKYKLMYEPEEATSYQLSIDSATVSSLTGLYNNGLKSKFKTQKKDYYGTALLTVNGLEDQAKVQLLKNSKDENLIKEILLKKGEREANFTFLSPGKYKIKLIVDKNENGQWDTGNLDLRIQPEPIYYYHKIVNIKSNWDLKETWNIDPSQFVAKDLADDDKKNEKE